MDAVEAFLLAQTNYLAGSTPQLISTTTLVATSATEVFAIPSGFNRVQVYWRVRCTDATTAEMLWLRMNGDTAAHYLWQVNQANNATVSGSDSSGAVAQIQVGTVPAASATAGYFGSGNFTVDGVADLANMATVVGTGSAYASTSNSWTGTYGGQYLTTGSAITSLTLLPGNSGAQFAIGSVFSVYGLI